MVCRKAVSTVIEAPTANQLGNIMRDMNETSEDKLLHNEKLLQEWIRCQRHFPKNIDKRFVRGFLRGCKHNLEKTKKQLEQHLAARNVYPEIYSNRSPNAKDVAQAMDVINAAVLPKMTDSGYRLLYFSLNRFDPNEFNMQQAVKLFFMIYELLISSESPACGVIPIFDAKGFSTGHLVQFSGPFFRTLCVLMREAYAIRVKQVHILNAPSLLSKMLTTIRPILHPKVRNAISVHKTNESFLNALGPELLPSNYGGKLKSARSLAEDWYEVLNNNTDWFEEQENVKITELPSRIEQVLYFKDQLGVEGSFRKLEID